LYIPLQRLLRHIDTNGERQLEQQIFDAILEMINSADQFILIDMFLFNDWQGPVKESHRALQQLSGNQR